jgi:hypothetical protein
MNGRPRPDQPPLTLDHKAGRIIQYAYTVPDLAAAMHSYIDLLHVGPWFRRDLSCRRGPSTAAVHRALS